MTKFSFQLLYEENLADTSDIFTDIPQGCFIVLLVE